MTVILSSRFRHPKIIMYKVALGSRLIVVVIDICVRLERVIGAVTVTFTKSLCCEYKLCVISFH